VSYTVNFEGEGETPAIPGKAPIVLPNNTLDTTSTSLVLTGKGVANWGEIQQENFLRLLDSCASNTAPANPTVGQKWFDSTTNTLRVYDMFLKWVPVGGVTISNAEPLNVPDGTLWYNSAENILYLKIPTTGNMANYSRRYFGGKWTQAWPHITNLAALIEYNEAATRINKIVGAPSTSGTDPNVANNQWGWGESDILPLYTSQNTPSTFDNNAWIVLLARLHKAVRHVDQTLVSENTIPTKGFIQDGRGWDNPVALTYSPHITWQAGWGGAGTVTMTNSYNTMLQNITDLETNRFTIDPTDTQWNVIATVSRPSWKTTKVLDIDVTFASTAELKRFFNAGGQIRVTFDISGYGTALAAAWDTLFTTTADLVTGGLCLDYKGTRVTPSGAYYNGSTSVGFYDLTGTLQTIYQIARGGSYGTGNLMVESNLTTNTIRIRCTFNEDYTSGDPSVDGTTSVAVQVRRSLGSIAGNPTINAPVVALPTAVTSGTFKTAPAE
jgi:hypothetical protein